MTDNVLRTDRQQARLLLPAACVLLGLGSPVAAQDPAAAPSDDYVARLKSCQSVQSDSERLACFDRAVGEIVTANDAGEVQIIDREDIRETRRQLFGLSVPDVGVLERGKDEVKDVDELFETTISSVTYLSGRKFRFTTAEGAVWEVNNAKSNLRTVEAGQRVNFKKASFGFYFARIDGQTGVKSKRVQ